MRAKVHRGPQFEDDVLVFGEQIEHHRAAKGGGQRGDQEAVIAPGDASGNGAGRVAAETVRGEPFAAKELAGLLTARGGEIDSSDSLFHRKIFRARARARN